MSSSTAIICAGCGWSAPPLHPTPFRCPRGRGTGDGGQDDIDHVLRRRIHGSPEIVDDPNPFIRFRRLTHAWHTAMEIGMSDAEFVKLVLDLDLPFRVTPFRW